MTKTKLVTIQMGGGSPRAHDTFPATAGKGGDAGSYRDWYFRPPNDAAIQAHHAKVRDAKAAKEAFERRNPGTYLLAGDDPIRVELSRLVKECDALRYEKAPLREPSPAERHELAVKALPPIAAIREWGRQWKAAREAREAAEAADAAERAGRRVRARGPMTLASRGEREACRAANEAREAAEHAQRKRCPHCGGKL